MRSRLRKTLTTLVMLILIGLAPMGCSAGSAPGREPPRTTREGAATEKPQAEAAAAKALSAPRSAQAETAGKDGRACTGAGRWYPAKAEELSKVLDGYLRAVPVEKAKVSGAVAGLVVPHAGLQYSGEAAAYAYALLKGQKIRRVVLLGFSHSYPLTGACVNPCDWYETPLGRVPVDREACGALLKEKCFSTAPEADGAEHSLENQLPFLQTVLGEFTLVPVMVGDGTERDFDAIADAIAPLVTEGTVVVASSDFTHYGASFGYLPFRTDVRASLEKLDMTAAQLIVQLDTVKFMKFLDETEDTICGKNPIKVLMRLMKKGVPARGSLRRYDTSGRTTGDWSHVVSYVSLAFTKPAKEGAADGELTKSDEKELLAIARSAVEHALKGERWEPEKPESPGLLLKRGAFVTLKNKGTLRGCIGNFEPSRPLYLQVAELAVSSALRDPRFAFNRITLEELPQIRIDISVLSPMERIGDPLDFTVGTHGIYINYLGARGTFLPQVATEQGWGKETFLRELCLNKIGIDADAWKKPECEVYRYGAHIIEEKD